MIDPAKAYDLYRTHGDAAEQVLRGAAQLMPSQSQRRVRIADIGAGSGPWGQRARFVFPGAHLTALEIRAEERPHLKRWYDDVQIGDFRAASVEEPFDLVMGNAPFFSLLEAITWGLRHVRFGGWICLLGPAGFGAEEGAEQLLLTMPPRHSLRLPGRLAFTLDGSDFQHHEALLWQRGGPVAVSPSWQTHLLPPLPPSSRRWLVVPGRERHPRPLPREFWPALDQETAHV